MTGWLYKQTGRSLWTVGFWGPDGEWNAESNHRSAEAAADRVHWLNGGQSHAEWLASGGEGGRIVDAIRRVERLT